MYFGSCTLNTSTLLHTPQEKFLKDQSRRIKATLGDGEHVEVEVIPVGREEVGRWFKNPWSL